MGRKTLNGGPAFTAEERLAQKRACRAASIEARKSKQRERSKRYADKRRQAAADSLRPESATTTLLPRHQQGDLDMDDAEDGEEDMNVSGSTKTAVQKHTGTRGPYTGTSQRTISRKAAEVRSALEAAGSPEMQAMVVAKVMAYLPSEALQAAGLKSPLDSKTGAALAANISNVLTLTKPGRGNQPIESKKGRDALLQSTVGDGGGIPASAWQHILGPGVTIPNIRGAMKAGKAVQEKMA